MLEFEYRRTGGRSKQADAPNLMSSMGSVTVDLTTLEGLQQLTIDAINAQAEFTTIETCCMIDDTLNDGTALIEFVSASLLSVENGTLTSTPLGDFTDEKLDTPYTVVGTASVAGDVGVAGELKVGRVLIENGATWSPGATTQGFVVRGVVANASTFTDSNGVVTSVVLDEVVQVGNGTADLFDTDVIVTAGAGDQLIITYTYLGAV